MKMKIKMKITATLLALMMLVSLVGVVFADDVPESGSENGQEATTPIVVIDGTAYTVNADGNPGDLCGSSEVNGDLTVNDYSPALEVRTGDAQQNSEFTVTGTVSDVVKVDSPDISQAVQAVAVQVSDTNAIHSDAATVTVGSAKAEATVQNGTGHVAEATAVNVTAEGQKNSATVFVGNDTDVEKHNATAMAKAEGNDVAALATAVYASAENNSTATVYVTGQAIASAEASENDSVSTIAVDIRAATGAEATVTIGEGAQGTVNAVAKSGATATVNILDGGIKDAVPNDDSNAALYVSNSGGKVNVNVEEGGITTVNSIGVQLVSDQSETGNETNLTIVGDVTAGQIGMDLMDVQEANIVVDGTVSGDDAAIVLRGDAEIGDNVQVTVWKIAPDENGAVVVREEHQEEVFPSENNAVVVGEGRNETNVSLQEDAEAEKLIQYIIKIDDSSAPYLAASGTKDFEAGNGETYKVANEGDRVLVKLAIPEGKELVGAYWDQKQTAAGKLLMDPSTGEYYVDVPRGGGVLLSLILKDAPKPEKREEESKAKAESAEKGKTSSKSAGKRDEDDDDEDTFESKPMSVNPYAIGAYYYVKGILQTNVMIGIQAQSLMAEAVFRAAIPAAWHEAFFLSMTVNGKNEYSKKEGTIVINIPQGYQKAGREYALLGMDKEGKIKTFTDQDRNQNTFTAGLLDFEGYQFMLIYKD